MSRAICTKNRLATDAMLCRWKSRYQKYREHEARNHNGANEHRRVLCFWSGRVATGLRLLARSMFGGLAEGTLFLAVCLGHGEVALARWRAAVETMRGMEGVCGWFSLLSDGPKRLTQSGPAPPRLCALITACLPAYEQGLAIINGKHSVGLPHPSVPTQQRVGGRVEKILR
jgi:hypothetical protein